MKRFLLLAGAAVVVLAAVLVYRAATVFEPRQTPALEVAQNGGPDRDQAITRLSGAVAIPTVSYDDPSRMDVAAFEQFRTYLQEQYPQVHQAMTREIVAGHSLVYALPGSDVRLAPVLLMGHYDVVPVDAADHPSWRHDPFGGELADGAVWGRGSVDDKLGVIALLESVENLLENGWRPARTLYLAFGHDEEAGGSAGAQAVADWFAERSIRFEFVLDEGGLVTEGIFDGVDPPVAVIGIGEKGWVNLELKVLATGGHSSQPPEHTAVGILAQAIVRIEDNPFPATFEYTAQTLETVAHAMPFSTRLFLANRWLLEPLIVRQLLADPANAAGLRTTTAATMISGSPKSNILPTHAEAVINFRILPGESVDSVRERIMRIVDDERVQISVQSGWNPSPVSPVDSEVFHLIAGLIRGLDPEVLVTPYVVRGGTDARYFYDLSDNVYRFVMARANAQTIEQIHGIDEHVQVEDYLAAIRFYEALITRATGGQM